MTKTNLSHVGIRHATCESAKGISREKKRPTRKIVLFKTDLGRRQVSNRFNQALKRRSQDQFSADRAAEGNILEGKTMRFERESRNSIRNGKRRLALEDTEDHASSCRLGDESGQKNDYYPVEENRLKRK